MTTIEALQEVYVTLGGQFEDVENIVTIPEMLTAINSVIDLGHSEPITSADVDAIVNLIS